MTVSLNDFQHNDTEQTNIECCNAENRYSECHDYLNAMLSVVMLSIVMLSVVILSVVMLSVVMLSVVAPKVNVIICFALINVNIVVSP
jgi:hypothetical protein